MNKLYDALIIGGGIVGTATGMILQQSGKYSTALIEAEKNLAAHQTGNNSGVIHSGLYYKPGSLKAVNCTEGRKLMYRFCQENNIKHEKCGKIVIAVCEDDLASLNELEKRGIANELNGLKRLSKDELKEYEPHVTGIAGLFVPETGIVDYKQVTKTYAKKINVSGGEVFTGTKFLSINFSKNEPGNYIVVSTTQGEFKTKLLINCGGLQSDRIARTCGVEPGLQIIPFRGEYYKLKKEKEYLVKNLIYPVPDPKFPFLGVHFTRMTNGGVEAGPNAVLSFKREGYSKRSFSIKDFSQMFSYPGFWRMAGKHYKMGLGEFHRSFSKKAFVKALQKLIPEIQFDDIHPEGAGVRAQALEPDGRLVDDFRIIETGNMIHVLNAPSPAATASLSIGNKIASMAIEKLK